MLHCDICTKTNNHCCKADIPLDIPIALALIEVSGNTNLEFKCNRVDLEQELINKFNLPNSTSISKVSELFNYENQREKLQQVLLHEQLNNWLFSNTILKG